MSERKSSEPKVTSHAPSRMEEISIIGEVKDLLQKLHQRIDKIEKQQEQTSISELFKNEFLKDADFRPLDEILKVECADGSEVQLSSDGIPKSFQRTCFFIATPETNYSTKVPVLIGTNILNEILNEYKM